MHFDTIEQFETVFSKNTNNLQLWGKLLGQNIEFIFQRKSACPFKINVARDVLGFWQQNLALFDIGLYPNWKYHWN